jgi:hypothetical protein
MQCKPYKNTHDGLYYVKSYDSRTYFYSKNDLIRYERKSNYEVAIFTRESLKRNYEVVRINKLKGVIRDEDTMLSSPLLMKHKAIGLNKEDDGDIDIDSSFCFILSQLHLAGHMHHVVI